MKTYWWSLGILAIGVWALLFIIPNADAQAISGTCSATTAPGAAGASRTWYFGSADLGSSSYTCTTTTHDTLKDVTAGGSGTCPSGATCAITLSCIEGSIGIAPAGATALTLKLYADNTAFGSPATATHFWTATPTGNSCTTTKTFTVWCTSDGTSTGSPRHGTVRLVVRAQNTNIGGYDVNSDAGNWGTFRCNPRITAYTDGNPSSSPTKYQGGDTLRTAITTGSAPYSGASNVRIDVACASSTNTAGSITLAASSVTIDLTIKGTTTAWPDDCSLTQKAIITGTSQISGLTSQALFVWDTGSPPASVTYPSNVEADHAAKTLDRTAAASSCTTNRARSGAGLSITLGCTWADPRGAALPNGRLAIGYTHRAATSLTDTTDAPSANAAADASSIVSWTVTLSSSATDTNSTPDFDYVESIETYGASRTAGELYNYGTSTGVFDVARTIDVTNLSTYRNVCNGAYPSTVFWIDHHVACTQEGPAQDPLGATITRALTFSRTYQGPGGASIASDAEASVTTGTSTPHYTVPKLPAGTWWYNVTVTDGLGNSGTRSQTVTFQTTQPSDEATGSGNSGDPMEVGAGYSWDSKRATIVVAEKYLNGTARTGAPPTIRIYKPDATELIHGQSPSEVAQGVYILNVYLGASPDLGAWNVTASVLQPGSTTENVTGGAVFVVAENIPLKIADLKSLVLDLGAWMNASFAYTNSLVNASRALDEANFTKLDAAIANITNGTAPGVNFTVTGDPGPEAGVYARKPAKFRANVANAGAWGALVLIWDFGDNTTTQGPVAYHAYDEEGNYTVSLLAYNALGQSGTISQLVRVNVSAPHAAITPPSPAYALQNMTFRSATSYDNHSEIVAWAWEMDPEDIDLGWLGIHHVNKGYGSSRNFTYVFTTAGNHTIRLTVTNAQGATNTTDIVTNVAFPPATPGSTAGITSETTERVDSFLTKVTRILQFLFG